MRDSLRNSTNEPALQTWLGNFVYGSLGGLALERDGNVPKESGEGEEVQRGW